MFFWHESIAKRGSAEVTSCILRYVETTFEPLQQNEDHHLTIWSDRCVGQNSSWRTIALLQHLLMSRYFTSVEQKFLVTGHSFLPCDRDFALTERNKKNFKAYSPDDWIPVIATAKTTGKGFLVYKMARGDFKDISRIESSLSKGSFKITEFAWLKLTYDDPSTLKGRKGHNSLQSWHTQTLTRKQRGKKDTLLPPVLLKGFPGLYEKSIAMKAAKKKDLLDICRYIPKKPRSFYEKLDVC